MLPVSLSVWCKQYEFADAGETYTRLTVGDGLVSQVPALIISVAAGILVSKAGMTDATDKVLFEQVANYPKALGMSAFMAVALGMLPGTPALPFMLLGSLTGITAYYLDKQQKIAQQRAAEVLEQEQNRELSPKLPTSRLPMPCAST